MQKGSFSSNVKGYLLLSLIILTGLFIYEIYFFPKYYDSFGIIENIYNGLYLKAIKTITLAIPSYLLSALFFFAALISPYRYRVFYFLLYTLAVSTEYSYQKFFNRFTNTEDFANIFFATDWRIRSNSVEEFFIPLSLIPCIIFLVLLIVVKPKQKQGLKYLLAVIVMFGSFFSITAYVSTNMFPTLSANALYRTSIAFPVNWFFGSLTQPALVNFYQKPREEITFQSQSLPGNNIVFIVDESMRGDHMSLNGYSRPTTPYLEHLNQKGYIKSWGIGVSGTTCSTTSNNLLLTGVSELPDVSGNVYRFPTIFQYAKAMGYKTYYFDGQLNYRWNGKETDLKDFGEWITPDDLNQNNFYDNDAEIARRVKEIVGTSTGNFIWINKFGVHIPYNLSYPVANAQWLPVPNQHGRFNLLQEKTAEERSNNYDNAILYNSESFFINLLKNGLAENTFYLYTSDHGQNLGEDGKTISHCSITINEANVPLFIIARPQTIPDIDTTYHASHANLFATVLDLMHFPENERKNAYAVSLLKATSLDSKPRYYFAGNLNSRHTNGKYLFDR